MAGNRRIQAIRLRGDRSYSRQTRSRDESEEAPVLSCIREIDSKVPDISTRPALRRTLQHSGNEIGFGRSRDGDNLNVASFLNLTLFGDHFFDTEEVWFLPIIVQGGISSGQFERSYFEVPQSQ